MENCWSSNRRIQASVGSHRDAVRSDWDRENAAKRVANVSLSRPGPRATRDRSLPVHGDRLRAARLRQSTGLALLPRRVRPDCSSTIGRSVIARDVPTHLGVQEPPDRTALKGSRTMTKHTETGGDTRRHLTVADPLLTPEEVSSMLGGVPPATLKRWRTQRTGPVALHIGRHVRYRLSAVELWLQTKDREAEAWMAS